MLLLCWTTYKAMIIMTEKRYMTDSNDSQRHPPIPYVKPKCQLWAAFHCENSQSTPLQMYSNSSLNFHHKKPRYINKERHQEQHPNLAWPPYYLSSLLSPGSFHFSFWVLNLCTPHLHTSPSSSQPALHDPCINEEPRRQDGQVWPRKEGLPCCGWEMSIQ